MYKLLTLVGILFSTAIVFAQTPALPVESAYVATMSLTTYVQDSLSVALREAREVANHVHGRGQFFGRHATQAGNVWALWDTLGTFHCTAGTGMAWGDTIKVLGSSDTPKISGMTYFDLHRVFLSMNSSDSLYAARLIYGATNASVELAAGHYVSFPFKFDSSAQISSGEPFEITMPRIPAGQKVWVQIKCKQDNATAKFLFSLHEYPQR